MPESRPLAGDLAQKASFSAAICASFRGQGATTTATANEQDAMTSSAPRRPETLHRARAQGLKILGVLPYPKGDGPPSRLPSDEDLGPDRRCESGGSTSGSPDLCAGGACYQFRVRRLAARPWSTALPATGWTKVRVQPTTGRPCACQATMPPSRSVTLVKPAAFI